MRMVLVSRDDAVRILSRHLRERMMAGAALDLARDLADALLAQPAGHVREASSRRMRMVSADDERSFLTFARSRLISEKGARALFAYLFNSLARDPAGKR